MDQIEIIAKSDSAGIFRVQKGDLKNQARSVTVMSNFAVKAGKLTVGYVSTNFAIGNNLLKMFVAWNSN